LFLAAAHLAFGQSAIVGVLACQAVAIVIPLAAIYWMMRRVLLAPPRACLATSLILSFDPAVVAHSAMVLSETWVFVLSSLVLAFAIAGISRGSYRYAALAGACSGMAALFHPSATYVCAVGGLAQLTVGERPFPRRVGLAFCLVVTHAIVLTPWLLRNYQLFGDPSLAGVRDRSLVLKAAIIEAYALEEPPYGLRGLVSVRDAEAAAMRSHRERQAGTSSTAGRALLATMLQHPRAAAITGLAGAAMLFFDPCQVVLLKALGQPSGTGLISGATHGPWEAMRTRPISTVVTAWSGIWILVFIACAAVGAVRWAGRGRPILVFCVAYCCYYTAVFSYGSLTAGGRYRIAMVPALALLASLAFQRQGDSAAPPEAVI
jgi:hypothetical protein